MVKLQLDIYADESFHDNWIYMGALFVPLHKKEELLNKLLDCRCTKGKWHENPCLEDCDHERHDTEVHYQDVGANYKFKIAKNWLELLLENNKKDLKLIYFNILGIDKSKIDFNLFDKRNREMSIYNRFFRTLLLGGIKYFFGEEVTIDHIFHDKGKQEHYSLFSWHPATKIMYENKIEINNKKIVFIDSDHRKEDSHPEESHFIQFLDIIMGSICCCFHPPTKDNKVQLGDTVKPLLKRMINKPKNTNSRYHYHRKQQVQFFPKNELKDETRELNLFNEFVGSTGRNNFYTERPIILKDRDQKTLDQWK